MNKRIQELLKQATTDALYETKDAIDFLDNPVSKQQRELQLEKFAELIVRECMRESMDEIVADEDIAQEKDPLNREYLKGNNQGIVDAVVRFRNHFGVEE